MPGPKLPSHCRHLGSGLHYVKFPGHKAIYTGSLDSDEATEKYHRLLAQWVANGFRLPDQEPVVAPTVSRLASAFLEFSGTYYIKDGKPTSEQTVMRVVCARLVKLYGSTPASEFSPDAFNAVRASWVSDGCCRNTCNGYGNKVKHIFKWGVTKGIVPPSVSHALRDVPALTRGRTGAREKAKVRPVEASLVTATLPYLYRPYWALIGLQWLTGMRPGEGVSMRVCDLVEESGCLVYRPPSHKTEHHDADRVIAIGPKARVILETRIKAAKIDTWDYVFRLRSTPKRHIDRKTYSQAVWLACKEAGLPHWHPNQLRHSHATMVRKRFGLEAAQVVLGHAKADMTQTYAEADLALAAMVAREIG